MPNSSQNLQTDETGKCIGEKLEFYLQLFFAKENVTLVTADNEDIDVI